MDYQTLKEHFTTLVARVLVEHIPYFAEDFKGLVKNHIPHQYSTEMEKKSEVVRCVIHDSVLVQTFIIMIINFF